MIAILAPEIEATDESYVRGYQRAFAARVATGREPPQESGAFRSRPHCPAKKVPYARIRETKPPTMLTMVISVVYLLFRESSLAFMDSTSASSFGFTDLTGASCFAFMDSMSASSLALCASILAITFDPDMPLTTSISSWISYADNFVSFAIL